MTAQDERIEAEIEIVSVAEDALALIAGGIVAMNAVGTQLQNTFTSVSS